MDIAQAHSRLVGVNPFVFMYQFAATNTENSLGGKTLKADNIKGRLTVEMKHTSELLVLENT